MFKLFKKNDTTAIAPKVTVLFHKQANGHIEHGTIYATNQQLGVNNEPVRFAFVEVSEAPLMTPDVLAHIWDQAERAGYIVHSLRSYATVFDFVPPPRLHSGASQRRNPSQQRQAVAVTPRKRSDQPDVRPNAPAVVN